MKNDRQFLSNGCARRGFLRAAVSAWVLLALVVLCGLPRQSQAQDSATLSGAVEDGSGAFVQNAHVNLVNVASKDVRKVITNSHGVFNFAALNPGSYTLEVQAKGFELWKLSEFELHPGDVKRIASIALKVGAEQVTVEVSASTSGVVLDSGELGSLITVDDMQHLATEGRSATELIKMMPGMAMMGNGTTNTGYDPSVSGIANSAQNSYSANGNSTQGIQVTLNGANIMDPGDNGAAATMNMDMVQEVNVQTSNYGADSARGPVVINAVGKSGSSAYHGEAYMLARNYKLNSQASVVKWEKSQQADPAATNFLYNKVQDHYYYPGGSIGGPIRVPGVRFTQKDKLLFYAGFEKYDQEFGGPLLNMVVPTDAMRAGDFSYQSLNSICSMWTQFNASNGYTGGGAGPLYCQVPTFNGDAGANGKPVPIVNGQVQQFIDPGGKALFQMFPHANITAINQFQPNNYFKQVMQNQNGWQSHNRIDFNYDDNNKVYISYNLQHENQQMPVNLYWTPGDSPEYPGGVEAHAVSHSTALHYTRIVSPSMTNEAVFTFTYYNDPFELTNPKAVNRNLLGYPYPTVYPNNSVMIPQIQDWVGAGYPMELMPGGFDKTAIFARKPEYHFEDNLSKTIKQHSIKVGFFFEKMINNEVNPADVQGQVSFYPWAYQFGGLLGGLNGWGGCNGGANQVCINPIASMLTGQASGYDETNKLTQGRDYYNTVAFYAQDSWKVGKHLTLDPGIRFDHIGPWTDSHGTGMAVWEPSLYASDGGVPSKPGGTMTPSTQYPGVRWHAIDKSVPLSGIRNVPMAFVSPRIGVAYDLHGNGRTVLRGGFGAYRFMEWASAPNAALTTGMGSYDFVASPSTFDLSQISTFKPPTSITPAADITGITLMDPKDNQRAATYDYNFTISQKGPWGSNMQVAYVGNTQRNLPLSGAAGASAGSVNRMPVGGLFKMYCSLYFTALNGSNCTNVTSNGKQGNFGGLTKTQVDAARPYPWYGEDIRVVEHNGKTNYNSLQASWNKQKGKLVYGANYTWSKSLTDTGSPGDKVMADKKVNYGPSSGDRSQIFNVTYFYSVGNLFHRNAIVKEVLNGWEISGITGVQSGQNLQAISSSNLSFGGSEPDLAGSQAIPLNSSELLGTPDVNLQPLLTCSPRSGLHAIGGGHQFINPNCFGIPMPKGSQIVNGPMWWPYIHAPHFINTDLTVSKNFPMGEKRRMQLKASGFNVWNHPNVSMDPNIYTNMSLTYQQHPNTGASGTKMSDYLKYPQLGHSVITEGRRVVEMSAKFYF